MSASTRPRISSRIGRTDVDVLAGGVVELPVLVALAGVEGAGVAAAHGDDDIGGTDDLVGPGLGELVGDVDADLGHGGDGGGVDLRAGLGARRTTRPRGRRRGGAASRRPSGSGRRCARTGTARRGSRPARVPSTRARAWRRSLANFSARTGR